MYKKKLDLIEAFIDAWKKLKKEKIISNQKDFTSQIAEWLIAELYNGQLAENGKQKDWDLIVDNIKYQVKGHAKSKTSKRRDTDFNYSIESDMDIFIIVVFDEEFKLKNIFKVPKNIIFQNNLMTIRKSGNVISWSKLKDFDILQSYNWSKQQKEILSIFNINSTYEKIEKSQTFNLKIIKTYLTSGFINISKAASKYLGKDGSILTLEFEDTQMKIPINRTSIGEDSVRLYKGQEMLDLINKNFVLNEEINIQVIDSLHIKLSK
ncbi:hypothetical protein [Maribacter stanieri]|uniref:hypothetical protein n=1 Tax=Maribacter stanieri TaxID=440514 RepID=UPI00249439FE|nr:hypothetical protein [Maribacter stanieri]